MQSDNFHSLCKCLADINNRIFLALDNATDSVVLDQCGLPQPGRTLRLQIRVW